MPETTKVQKRTQKMKTRMGTQIFKLIWLLALVAAAFLFIWFSSVSSPSSSSSSSSVSSSSSSPSSSPSSVKDDTVEKQTQDPEAQNARKLAGCPPQLEQSLNSKRFLLIEPLPSKMGLTNGLIAYSEALFLASRLMRGRTLVITAAGESSTDDPFSPLVDLRATCRSLCLPDRCMLTSHDAQFKTFVEDRRRNAERNNNNKKAIFGPRLKLPGRTLTIGNPDAARSFLVNHLRYVSASDLVRAGNVFWHVPVDKVHAARYFAGIQFKKEVHQEAERILKEKILSVSSLLTFAAALHLRIEPDITGFSSRFAPPSKQQLSRFLSSCVIPQLEKKGFKFVILLGSLITTNRELVQVCISEFESKKIRILSKYGELTSSSSNIQQMIPSAASPSASNVARAIGNDNRKAAVTNHFDAAVDALIGASASTKLLIGADYSTFTKAIQIRRCAQIMEKKKNSQKVGESEEKGEDEDFMLLTYDHELTRIRSRHSCEEVKSSFATTPHSFVPGFDPSQDESRCAETGKRKNN